MKLSDEKPSRGSVTATMKSREEDTYLIHLLLGRRGTGGTRGYSKDNPTFHGVPGGVTRWDRSLSRGVPEPLVPPFGTTLMSLEPFEYHHYPLYHLDTLSRPPPAHLGLAALVLSIAQAWPCSSLCVSRAYSWPVRGMLPRPEHQEDGSCVHTARAVLTVPRAADGQSRWPSLLNWKTMPR